MLDKAKGNGKRIVHKGLEGCCCSAQAKKHDQRLMFALLGVKGSLLNRRLFYKELSKARSKIMLSKPRNS